MNDNLKTPETIGNDVKMAKRKVKSLSVSLLVFAAALFGMGITFVMLPFTNIALTVGVAVFGMIVVVISLVLIYLGSKAR